MYYVIHGSDSARGRKKFHELVDSLRAKKPDAALFVLNPDTWDAARFEELIAGASLFSPKYIVACDGLATGADSKAILGQLEAVAASPHIFVFLESVLDEKTLSAITEHAEKVQEFALPRAGGAKKPVFNIYTVSDALGRRDRRGLWVAFQGACAAGVSVEEQFWKCVWQVKNMLLVARTPSASAAVLGINPYVFDKARAAAGNFTGEELARMSGELVDMYHRARRGLSDFEIDFERWMLSI